MSKARLIILFILLFSACQQKKVAPLPFHKIAGKTMGTYYEITFQDSTQSNYQQEIDQLLIDFNRSLSTYIPKSLISEINHSIGKIEVDAYFARVFKDAKEVYQSTSGAFDPTIMPLVNFWGFGFETIPERDESKRAELHSSMGFNELKLSEDVPKYKVYLNKPRLETQIDFSAIAKGTGVDIIAEYLDRQQIDNYLINIGGEVRAKGKNNRKTWWSLGVNTPKENVAIDDYQEIVSLQNKSMASSGNYRNHKVIDGQKVVHTINPKTGKPVISNLLSVTIIANECAIADAFATACMVLGVEEAQDLINKDYRIEGLLIFSNGEGEILTWKSEAMPSKPATIMP